MAQQQTKQTPPQAPPPGQQVARSEAEHKRDAMSDLQRFFSRKDVVDRIEQVLPKHLRPDRIIRIGLAACNRSPNLWQVPPMELFGGILFFAAVGLEPNSPLAHGDLVPVPKRARVNNRYETVGYTLETFIRYGGWLELMRRSGSLLSVHCDIVLPEDEFEFEHGSNAHLKHKPQPIDFDPDQAEGLEYEWAYSFFRLREGAEHFEALPRSRILRIRNQTAAYRQALADIQKAGDDPSQQWRAEKARKAPWIAHEIPMAKKTMLLQGRKWVPISVEVMGALAFEDAQSSGKTLDLAKMVNFDTKNADELPTKDASDEPAAAALEHSKEEPINVVTTEENAVEQPEKVKAEPARQQSKTHDGKPVSDGPPNKAAQPSMALGDQGQAEERGPGGPRPQTQRKRPNFT